LKREDDNPSPPSANVKIILAISRLPERLLVVMPNKTQGHRCTLQVMLAALVDVNNINVPQFAQHEEGKLRSVFFFGLLDPEDGGDVLLRNAG
jgi:hypothetical protein